FTESKHDFIILSELAAGMSKTLTWLTEVVSRDTRIRLMLTPSESLPTVDMPAPSAAPLNRSADIVGESPTMLRLRNLLASIGRSQASVLITGETGTGKELVACEIHRRSFRAAKRFVAINCAAIPDTLLESELFGVER